MIQLSKDWRLGSDKHNYILYKSHTSEKTGEKIWEEAAYFVGLEGVASYIINHQVRATGLRDVETVIQAIKAATSEIKAELLKLVPEVRNG